MQQNREKTAITGMSEGEILVYQLYVEEGLNHGLRRDALPHTSNFDRMVSRYNQQMNTSDTPNEIWLLLARVLKNGVEQIEDYLHRIAATGTTTAT